MLKLDLADIHEGNTSRRVAYSKTEIISDKDRTLDFTVYGERELSIRINGDLTFDSNEIVYGYKFSANLKKGVNKILVKTAFTFPKPFGGREYGFCLKASGPSEGLKVR